jgi:hypothetical protein
LRDLHASLGSDTSFTTIVASDSSTPFVRRVLRPGWR